MTFSLYDATVPVFIQLLEAQRQLADRAEAHCKEQGLAADAILNARIIDDMEPYGFQIKAVAMQSMGGIEAVRKGSFSPDPAAYPDSFDAVREKLDSTIAALKEVSADEVNSFLGQPMQFKLKEMVIPFTAEGFLMSFSMPNFHFHTTTAFDILRAQGLDIGKVNYLGQMQIAAG